jgi:hypothetical protein
MYLTAAFLLLYAFQFNFILCRNFKTTIYRQTVTNNYLLRCVITGSTGILPKTYLKNIPKIFQKYSKDILKIFMQK